MKRRLKMVSLLLAAATLISAFSMEAMAAKGDEKYRLDAAKIAETYKTTPVETIKWAANISTTKSGVKVKCTDGIKVTLTNGTKVTVVQRDYHAMNGKSECLLESGQTAFIKNQYLKFTDSICSGKKTDYDIVTKATYVNYAGKGKPITSKTNKLIWVSLDKQMVNVFVKQPDKSWKFEKAMPCSTGAADAPTLDETFKYSYLIQYKSPKVLGLQYYSAFYGSGFHLSPGAGKAYIGKKPMSHSCIRMKDKDAKWMYDNTNIPLKTRVWVF